MNIYRTSRYLCSNVLLSSMYNTDHFHTLKFIHKILAEDPRKFISSPYGNKLCTYVASYVRSKIMAPRPSLPFVHFQICHYNNYSGIVVSYTSNFNLLGKSLLIAIGFIAIHS